MSGATLARRRVPHHKSLLGMVLLGGLIAGTTGFAVLGYKRWMA